MDDTVQPSSHIHSLIQLPRVLHRVIVGVSYHSFTVVKGVLQILVEHFYILQHHAHHWGYSPKASSDSAARVVQSLASVIQSQPLVHHLHPLLEPIFLRHFLVHPLL